MQFIWLLNNEYSFTSDFDDATRKDYIYEILDWYVCFYTNMTHIALVDDAAFVEVYIHKTPPG